MVAVHSYWRSPIDRCLNGSIDIAPIDDDALTGYFENNQIGSNVNLITGDSRKIMYPAIGEIDLLFIDCDHSYEGCREDLENWYPKVVPGGHIVLHDSYFGCEVQSATIDFIHQQNVEIIQTPYISASHWRFPCGSLAHFKKRS